MVYLDRATPQPKESVLGKVRIMMKCECVGPFLSTVASDVRIIGIAFLDPPSDPCEVVKKLQELLHDLFFVIVSFSSLSFYRGL